MVSNKLGYYDNLRRQRLSRWKQRSHNGNAEAGPHSTAMEMITSIKGKDMNLNLCACDVVTGNTNVNGTRVGPVDNTASFYIPPSSMHFFLRRSFQRPW